MLVIIGVETSVTNARLVAGLAERVRGSMTCEGELLCVRCQKVKKRYAFDEEKAKYRNTSGNAVCKACQALRVRCVRFLKYKNAMTSTRGS